MRTRTILISAAILQAIIIVAAYYRPDDDAKIGSATLLLVGMLLWACTQILKRKPKTIKGTGVVILIIGYLWHALWLWADFHHHAD
ncbi:MAG: hypothetical protein NTY98_23660 [Verrucomicrobia bacterium]|nr:hypothetical protein [Verrucomicrobiota bacterium]